MARTRSNTRTTDPSRDGKSVLKEGGKLEILFSSFLCFLPFQIDVYFIGYVCFDWKGFVRCSVAGMIVYQIANAKLLDLLADWAFLPSPPSPLPAYQTDSQPL